MNFNKLISIEGLTLLAAVLTLGATLYFGLFPRSVVVPKRDDNLAYIGGKPAIRVLNSLASSDVSGALRSHLFYKDDPAHPLKQGDMLTFRVMTLAVIMIFPASQNGDNDPTHLVALCRVIGGA
jgi:hypothetical protein